jgi:hypothetical protein
MRLVSELDTADQRAQELPKGLTPRQLIWQPRQDAWSVGQCLEHLRVANEMYLPAIAASLTARPTRCGSAHHTGLVRPVVHSQLYRTIVRIQTGSRSQEDCAKHPGRSSYSRSFLTSNQAVRELVRRASEYDVNRIRSKNPFIPVLRFTVGKGLEIVSRHQRRHLLQAERVKQAADFPGRECDC